MRGRVAAAILGCAGLILLAGCAAGDPDPDPTRTAPAAVPTAAATERPVALVADGSAEDNLAIFADVTERVFDVYGDDTWVYPGHGSDTTLGAERPHLEEWRERGW